MSRGLGPTQRAVLELVQTRGCVTIAELAEEIDSVGERRLRAVVASLKRRRLVRTTTEKISEQAGTGRPVHALLVWEDGALYRRDADAWRARRMAIDTQRFEARRNAVMGLKRETCPTCGHELPIPLGNGSKNSPMVR